MGDTADLALGATMRVKTDWHNRSARLPAAPCLTPVLLALLRGGLCALLKSLGPRLGIGLALRQFLRGWRSALVPLCPLATVCTWVDAAVAVIGDGGLGRRQGWRARQVHDRM